MRGPIVACLIVLVATGCNRTRPPAVAQGEFPERYRFLREVMVPVDDLARVRNGLPYERIESTESGTWFTDRKTIVLERNGSISMSGSPSKAGTVSIFDYGGLCYLIERIGFESMEPRYEWDGFDAATYTVKVWRVGSDEPIVVEDYGSVGPPDLWTLRTAIEGVAAGARWKP